MAKRLSAFTLLATMRDGARWREGPRRWPPEVARPARSRPGRGESVTHPASPPPICGECGLALRWEQIAADAPERWLAVCACGMPWAFFPRSPRPRAGRPARGGARRRPRERRRVAALDPALPADLGLPVVAPLAPRRGRLREVPAGRDVRGLDVAAPRPPRVLGAVPRLRPGDQRVPIDGERAAARGAGVGERVEPAVRRRRSAAPGSLLPATGLDRATVTTCPAAQLGESDVCCRRRRFPSRSDGDGTAGMSRLDRFSAPPVPSASARRAPVARRSVRLSGGPQAPQYPARRAEWD
jgi:hypothetical protein